MKTLDREFSNGASIRIDAGEPRAPVVAMGTELQLKIKSDRNVGSAAVAIMQLQVWILLARKRIYGTSHGGNRIILFYSGRFYKHSYNYKLVHPGVAVIYFYT